MPSKLFLRKSIVIIISFLVLLSISVIAFATEQATEPADTSTEAITTDEASPTNGNEDDDEDKVEKAKDRKNAIKVAFIGLAGGAVPAIISAIFQSISTKKTLKNSKDQFKKQMALQEQTLKNSDEQFKEQMAHSKKELSIQLEQIRNEQERYANAKKEEAIKMLNTEEYNESKNIEKRIVFYTQTLNAELKRIEALSHPSSAKERENKRWYNPIINRLSGMDFGCELHSIVITNIGQLLKYIDGYNYLKESELTFDVIAQLEDYLHSIYSTVTEIEKDVADLLKEDKKLLSEYYKKSAELMFETARQLEPQTNIDSEESKKTE